MRIQLGNNNLNNRRMGQTIEEKMKDYNEMKEAMRNLSKNKEKYKAESNKELARTSWGTVILVALICILIGAFTLYSGINSIKRSIANADDKEYITAEIEHVWSRSGSNGGAELEIEYYVGNSRLTDRITTAKDREQFMRGQSIRVYYYKDNPNRIYLASEEIASFFTPIVGVIFISVGFVAIFAKIKAGNIKRRK